MELEHTDDGHVDSIYLNHDRVYWQVIMKTVMSIRIT